MLLGALFLSATGLTGTGGTAGSDGHGEHGDASQGIGPVGARRGGGVTARADRRAPWAARPSGGRGSTSPCGSSSPPRSC
ncbi:hypothetical protein K7G98_15690 [Saccharothrix sp. MB29]|nr:hypothetical protein [Saccharothrix sp. MB29]